MIQNAVVLFLISIAMTKANECALVPVTSSFIGWLLQQTALALPLHTKYVKHFIPALKEFQMPMKTYETRHNILGLDAEMNFVDADVRFNDLGSLAIKPIHWNVVEGILETGLVQLPEKEITADAFFLSQYTNCGV